MKKPLLEALKDRPLLGDGAMGTQLMIAGLEQEIDTASSQLLGQERPDFEH